MIRVLPVVLEFALLAYGLVHCIQAPREGVRHLPKWAWIVLIVLVPFAGPIAYLLAGRPRGAAGGRPPSPPERQVPRGPDDDPDFLRGLDRYRQKPADGDTSAGPDGQKP